MKHEKQEALLRETASRYMEQWGQDLLREMGEISAAEITPSLDRKVRGRIRAHKQRKYARWMAPVAACIVVALLVPGLLRLDPGPSDAAPAPAGDAGTAEAPDFAADAGDREEWEILPLSFRLPDGFAVAEVEQDREKTVYTLDNAALDDVVMTLQTSPGEIVYDDLTPIDIGGAVVYGEAKPDYKLLAFESDGIHYVLTCRHDINTLAQLAVGIV